MNERPENKKRSGKRRFFDCVNGVLLVLIIGLLGNVVSEYYFSLEVLRSSTDEKKANGIKPFSVRAAVNEVKPFSVYEQGVRKRDLFQPVIKNVAADKKTLKTVLPALHTRIRLIGILLDDDSKAIVEDLKEGQTYFLSKGESLGSAMLEDITRDKVVFLYNNERIEMTP